VADDSLGSFGRKVGGFIDELEAEKLRAMATKVGVKAKQIATDAASADLGGDPAFSGWRPATNWLATRFDHLDPGVISFHPTKRSAGPWTVAEFGRNRGEGPRMVGPRLTKTGKVSKARQRRYNGQTAGKGTASDALAKIEPMVPAVVDAEVTKAIRKFFS
jgi:hypothetical protein